MPLWGIIDQFVQMRFRQIVICTMAVFAVVAIPYIFMVEGHDDGAEPEIIARSIVAGHGFSFEARKAWLCSDLCEEAVERGVYTASAWADPVYPYVFAALLTTIGDYFTPKILRILGVFAFVGTGILVAETARRLAGPWAGLVALGFLLIITRNLATAVNPSTLAAALVALLIYLWIRHFRSITSKHAWIFGGLMGITILTWSSTVIFVPVFVLLLLATQGVSRKSLASGAIIAVTAMAIVAPWTIRNYIVFDEFVPVRNGLGYLAFMATAGVGNTYLPAEATYERPTPWRSKGSFDAVSRITFESSNPERDELDLWRSDVIDDEVGLPVVQMTEASRDHWFFDESLRFIYNNPGAAFMLGIAKINAFMTLIEFPLPNMGAFVFLASLATFVGVIVGTLLIVERPQLMVPALMTWAFIAPFALISPYYYRYRQPIEPAIAVLVGVSLVLVLRKVLQTAWGQRAVERVRQSFT